MVASGGVDKQVRLFDWQSQPPDPSKIQSGGAAEDGGGGGGGGLLAMARSVPGAPELPPPPALPLAELSCPAPPLALAWRAGDWGGGVERSLLAISCMDGTLMVAAVTWRERPGGLHPLEADIELLQR